MHACPWLAVSGVQCWLPLIIEPDRLWFISSLIHKPLQLILNSMHKYLPRVCIVEETGASVMAETPSRVFCFHETAFIAVTAYQNEKVSTLPKPRLCKCAWNTYIHTRIHTPLGACVFCITLLYEWVG